MPQWGTRVELNFGQINRVPKTREVRGGEGGHTHTQRDRHTHTHTPTQSRLLPSVQTDGSKEIAMKQA